MLEKNYLEVPLSTVSEQVIQTPRGGKPAMCNLLSRSGVTVPLKDQVLPSKCKQKTLPSKCPFLHSHPVSWLQHYPISELQVHKVLHRHV